MLNATCSGDTDSVCSGTSSRYSINRLKLPTETPWRPWNYSTGEVGGYVIGYRGLIFATVRGAGHMVPSYQPRRALTLISSFLQGTLPPAFPAEPQQSCLTICSNQFTHMFNNNFVCKTNCNFECRRKQMHTMFKRDHLQLLFKESTVFDSKSKYRLA